MRVNVSKYVRKALESHRTIRVDGLGVFSLMHESAELNHRDETVQPPADTAVFKEEVDREAEQFSDFLEEMLDIDSDRARLIVRKWVDQLQTTIDTQGSVELPGLGILEKTGDNLQWTPHTEEEMALQPPWPVLYFTPWKKKQTASSTAVPSASGGSARKIGLWIAGITAVLMLIAALGYWTMYHSPEDPINWSGVDQSRVNKSPGIDSYYVQDTHLTPESTAQKPKQGHPSKAIPDTTENNYSEDKTERKDSPVQKSSPDEHPSREKKGNAPSIDCVVVVGAFGKQSNVTNMLDVLREEGYTTYTEAHDGLTRVGVRTPCVDEELLRTLRSCRTSIEEKAWILGRRPQ